MFMFYLCKIIDCLYIKKILSCKTVKAFHSFTLLRHSLDLYNTILTFNVLVEEGF